MLQRLGQPGAGSQGLRPAGIGFHQQTDWLDQGGVLEAHAPGMEADDSPGGSLQGACCTVAVVPQQGATPPGKLGADLVGATCFGPNQGQGQPRHTRHQSVIKSGLLGTRATLAQPFGVAHSLALGGPLRAHPVEHFALVRQAVFPFFEAGQVDLGDFFLVKLARQPGRRLAGPGEQNHPAGGTVEPMDDPQVDIARLLVGGLEVFLRQIGQGDLASVGGWGRGQPRWFVECQQMIILQQDGGNGLGHERHSKLLLVNWKESQSQALRLTGVEVKKCPEATGVGKAPSFVYSERMTDQTKTGKSSNNPRITFFGAARMVTGSMHLLEAGGQRILLDCGSVATGKMNQDKPPEPFPFDPQSVDAVVLTHSHHDHCGRLATLVRDGFDGPIFTHPINIELLGLLLRDSARIQEQEASTSRRRGGPVVVPRFDTADAELTLDLCEPIEYGQKASLSDGIEVGLRDAGHILGSAMAHIAWRQNDRDRSLTFTGDLGRSGVDFHPPPAALPACDYLLCESTYGGEYHDSVEVMARKTGQAIRRAVREGGKVLIPAFSLGRTQMVVHFLQTWMREGIVPPLDIHVDSPLGHRFAKVYDRSPEGFSVPLRIFDDIDWLETRDGAMDASLSPGSRIIIASGGMLEGGRILQHLKHHVDDPRCTLLLVSFQAPGTLGEQALQEDDSIRFAGKRWNKWIAVEQVRGFSGHADHGDFLNATAPLEGKTTQVMLVHGEEERAEKLAAAFSTRGLGTITIPNLGQTVELV